MTRRSSEASELSKPPGLFILSFQDTPNSTQKNQSPVPTRVKTSSYAHMLTWHSWCQEQKLLIREKCSHEVFFFSLCPLRQVDYFKPKLPELQEQHNFVPTSHVPIPCPPPGSSEAPPFPLPHTPVLCHCSPDKRPSGSAYMGPRALIKVGCCHEVKRLFLLLFCFQPTREQREKPGSTHKQIQSKETERQQFRGRSPERRHQGGRMPQMARPLNGWNQVFSHSLTLG